MNERMKDFERRSRTAFDESVVALDGATRSRLARARQLALAGTRRGGSAWRSAWLPAGAAAAAVLAVTLWNLEDAADSVEPAMVALEELDIVTAGEDFEMLDEDPGFYAWAAGELAEGVG